MSSRSKNQMTAAKKAREFAVKERRALKQEKKQAAAAARRSKAAGITASADIAEQSAQAG